MADEVKVPINWKRLEEIRTRLVALDIAEKACNSIEERHAIWFEQDMLRDEEEAIAMHMDSLTYSEWFGCPDSNRVKPSNPMQPIAVQQAPEKKPRAISAINWKRLEEIKDRLLFLSRVVPKNYGERNKICNEEGELWQEEKDLTSQLTTDQVLQWIAWRNTWVPLVDRFFNEPAEIEEQAMIPAQDWLKDPQNRTNLLRVLRDALLGYQAVPKTKLDTRQQRRGEWVTQFRRSFLHLLGTRKTWRHRTIIISSAHIFEELSSTSFWYDAGIVAEYPGVENLLSSQIKLLMEQIMEETDNELDPQISLQKIDNLMLMMQDCINTMNSQAKNLAAETHTFNAYMEK